MESITILLNKKQLKKLLKNQTVQVAHSNVSHLTGAEDDVSTDDNEMRAVVLHVEADNKHRLYGAARTNKGMRLKLTPDEIAHNAKMSKHFQAILTKAQKQVYGGAVAVPIVQQKADVIVAKDETVSGNTSISIPINLRVMASTVDIEKLLKGESITAVVEREFEIEMMPDRSVGRRKGAGIKQFGRQLKRGFQKMGSEIKDAAEDTGKFLNKHRKVLATVANQVGLPAVGAVVKSYTGVDINPALKPAQGLIQKAIDRKLSKGAGFLPSGY